MIQAVLFDVIGTTVKEADPEIIPSCFQQAFDAHAVKVDLSVLKKNRGKDKRIMIREILYKQKQLLDLLEPIYRSFEQILENNLHQFSEVEGAGGVFHFLKEKGVKVAVGTGLPEKVFQQIFEHLHWQRYAFDYVGTASSVGKSRPQPDMIFDMMRKTGIQEAYHILKIGDTMADIQEGKNAGAQTAVVLAGTQDSSDLIAQGPDFVIKSLHDVKEIVVRQLAF